MYITHYMLRYMVHKRHGGFTTGFEIIVISWRLDGAGEIVSGVATTRPLYVKTNREHPQSEK